MNGKISLTSFVLTVLLLCQTNCSTTETVPTAASNTVVDSISEQNDMLRDRTETTTSGNPSKTTSRSNVVVESIPGHNDTLQDVNQTDAATTESRSKTQEQQISTSAATIPDFLETTSPGMTAVYVTGDSGIENGSTYAADVTTQKETLEVSTSPALNDVSQVNKIITESPQGQDDTHVTTDLFSQTTETTTKQSIELSTETKDKITKSSTFKGTPSTTPYSTTSSEYLHVEQKDTVGKSVHPGKPATHAGVVIIGAVLAFFCVAILVAVVLVFRRRRQSIKQKVMMNFDLNRMDLRSIRHQPPNVVVVDFPLKQEVDLWQEVKPMNSSVI